MCVVCDFEQFNVDDPESVCISLCVSVSVSVVCVCDTVSLTSNYSETVEIIITKPGTVTASDASSHHVLILLTLTFIQGLTYLKHENKKCSIMTF